MFLAGVVLAPLAQFDDLGAGQRLLGFERVGRQFDLRAVGAELGDDPACRVSPVTVNSKL